MHINEIQFCHKYFLAIDIDLRTINKYYQHTYTVITRNKTKKKFKRILILRNCKTKFSLLFILILFILTKKTKNHTICKLLRTNEYTRTHIQLVMMNDVLMMNTADLEINIIFQLVLYSHQFYYQSWVDSSIAKQKRYIELTTINVASNKDVQKIR